METLSDIVAEMRDEMTGTHYVADGMINSLHKAQAELRVLADRIEAAWRREKAEIESDALVVGGIVEEERHKPGNAAAMREACANIAEYARTARCHTDDAHVLVYLEQIEKWAESALSEPARNCDRFADELDAQLAFLNEVWLISVDRETMLERDKYENWTDEMRNRYGRWLLAPAAERKGDGDGR